MLVRSNWLRSQCGGTLYYVSGVESGDTVTEIAKQVERAFWQTTTCSYYEDRHSDCISDCYDEIVVEASAPKGYAVVRFDEMSPKQAEMVCAELNKSDRTGPVNLSTADAGALVDPMPSEGCGDCYECDRGYPEDCEYHEPQLGPTFSHNLSVGVNWHWLEGTPVIIGVTDFSPVEQSPVGDAVQAAVEAWDGGHYSYSTEDIINGPVEGLSLTEDAAFMLEPYGETHRLWNIRSESRIELTQGVAEPGVGVRMPVEFQLTAKHRTVNGTMTLRRNQLGDNWDYSDTHQLPTLLSALMAAALGPSPDSSVYLDEDGWWFFSSHVKFPMLDSSEPPHSSYVNTETLIHWLRHFPDECIEAAAAAGFEIEEIKTFAPTRNGNECLHVLDAVAIKGGWVI